MKNRSSLSVLVGVLGVCVGCATTAPHHITMDSSGSYPSNSVVIKNDTKEVLRVYRDDQPWETQQPTRSGNGASYSLPLLVMPRQLLLITNCSSQVSEHIVMRLEGSLVSRSGCIVMTQTGHTHEFKLEFGTNRPAQVVTVKNGWH